LIWNFATAGAKACILNINDLVVSSCQPSCHQQYTGVSIALFFVVAKRDFAELSVRLSPRAVRLLKPQGSVGQGLEIQSQAPRLVASAKDAWPRFPDLDEGTCRTSATGDSGQLGRCSGSLCSSRPQAKLRSVAAPMRLTLTYDQGKETARKTGLSEKTGLISHFLCPFGP
jgi:hypothetical protein